MWFKDNGRILQACARLTHQEIGILYCLIGYAWSKQGIVESDLSDFAGAQRLTITAAQIAWQDFLRLAVQREGKWLLPEQWDGLESHQRAKEKAEAMARSRWNKRKLTESSQYASGMLTASDKQSASNADLDLELDKITPKANKGGGAAHARGKSFPLPATPEAAERQRAIDKATDFLIERYRLPIIKFAEQYEIASLTVCQTVKAGCEIAALEDFFRERNGKKTELRFLPEDFAAWAAWKKGEANGAT